jgi:hypothetical protein
VICFTTSAGECRSMRRLWILAAGSTNSNTTATWQVGDCSLHATLRQHQFCSQPTATRHMHALLLCKSCAARPCDLRMLLGSLACCCCWRPCRSPHLEAVPCVGTLTAR